MKEELTRFLAFAHRHNLPDADVRRFDSIRAWYANVGNTTAFDGRGALRNECLICDDYTDRKKPHAPGCPMPAILQDVPACIACGEPLNAHQIPSLCGDCRRS